MATCTQSSARSIMRWRGRIKYLLLNGIHFVNMQVGRKLKGTLELMWKKGIGIILNIVSMPRTINYLFIVAMEVLLGNLQMGWQEKTRKGSSNLPWSYICCNKVVPCKNMKQTCHCMNSWQCKKTTRNMWSDSFGWTMVEFVHQEVMKA